MNRTKWFSDARFGLFIHWGAYAAIGRGEWVMYRERIPAAEYAELAKKFNPVNFNMDTLCKFAADNGMKYMVLTTCHHDGYAMFDSKADAFNSMNWPPQRDFIAEYVTSCRKYGLKVGLYYSLGDWRFGIMKESDCAEQAEKMRALTFAHVRELMTNYGKIDILWYDGGWCYPSTPTDTMEDVARFWHADELNSMVRSLQPDIIINNRSGTPEDFSTPEGVLGKPSKDKCCEACFTLGENANSHWGYFKNECLKKSKEELMLLALSSITFGNNLLLNVGPDENGVIPDWQAELIRQLGGWLNRNPEAAYTVGFTEVSRDINGTAGNEFCRIAENDEAIFCYLQNWPENETFIPVMKSEISEAILMNSDAKITFTRKDRGILLQDLPAAAPDPLCSVIKLIKKK